MASKKAKRTWLAVGILVVIAGLWVTALAISAFTEGFSGGYAAGSGEFEEVLLEEGDSPNKIAMINVIGEIFSDPEGGAVGATDYNILNQLEQAEEDPDVVGIILNVDTPGGGVIASDAIYNRVTEIAEDLPVVALMGDTAASGGYYISAGATEIIAHRFTWTGSIGVIAMIPNFTEAADKLGVGMTVVKSGALKDIGSPFREMSEEERALFQTLIDEAYNGFVEVVAEGRDLPEDLVRQIADGRIYSGQQARELDLVDRLGDRDTAFTRAKRLADDEDASLVVYRPVPGLFDQIPFLGFNSPADEIKEELGIPRKPGAAYLWIP
ncbi:MAG TPA: signal peptide peptidase SppA [Actinomycetota bacterium]|nr:signal peptide peptidase SppA [Actinomycetota bacterium]